jgi:RNA-directed DNA polymerase
MKDRRSASAKPELRPPPQAVEETPVTDGQHQSPIAESLLAQVLEPDNLVRALNQVKRNKGAAGVDGMTVAMLPGYLKHHWRELREQLLNGNYQPQAVKRVEIPKADGRKRKLGIPTVVDRFIQQAVAQVLSRQWEPEFHPHSYGFRPKRSAHQAVRHAQALMVSGKQWVVDIDLASFFDRVNHDRLMHKLRGKITEQPLLHLIRRYLKAPVRMGKQTSKSREGVPQGGPLSPLLANIVLNELDWELEKRGHGFARYADDCQIYVGSERAGERVMASVQHFIERSLRLMVNNEKSAVDCAWNRKFLGFSFSRRAGHKLKVSDKALEKLKDTVRGLCRRTRGHSIGRVIADLRESLLGWRAYFGIAEVKSLLQDTDKWIRRKLRCYLWKQWGPKGYRMLRRLGIDRQLAWNTAKSAHGPWRLSKSPALYRALPNRYFANLGLPSLVA